MNKACKYIISWYLIGLIVSSLTIGLLQNWQYRKIDLVMCPTLGAVAWPFVVIVAASKAIFETEGWNEVVLDFSKE